MNDKPEIAPPEVRETRPGTPAEEPRGRLSRLAATVLATGAIPPCVWVCIIVCAAIEAQLRGRWVHFWEGVGWLSIMPVAGGAIFVFPVTLVLGLIALCRIRRGKGLLRGKGQAIAGMFLPLCPLVLFEILPLVLIVAPVALVIWIVVFLKRRRARRGVLLLLAGAMAASWPVSGTGAPVDAAAWLPKLKDQNPRIRREAVINLGWARATNSVPRLMDIAEEDPDRSVRSAAFDALGRIRDRRAIPLLVRQLSERDNPRNAAWSLDQMEWKPSNDAERAWYCYAKGEWKALAQIGTAADEALSRALTEQKGDERRHIVYELRMTNHPSLLAPLRRIAEDRSEDGSTRVHAVKAVAKTGGVGADACVRALLSDSEPHVRIAACDALCAKGMPGASEALGTLIYDPDPEARAWARHRAGAPPRGAPVIKPAIPLDVLARELKSPDEAVRTEVVEALGRRSDGTGIPFLLEVFDGSHSSDLRRDALNAIGRMDSPESRAVVRRAFDDPDPWVRKTAAGHLAARRTTEAAELIAARIPHEEPWLQFEMAKSMAHIGSNAVPPLLTLLQNTNDKVRSTAAEALGWIGDPRAVDALIPLLDDGEGRVGGMAQGALSQLGGTKAERAINRRVRRWQRAAFMATSAGGHMAALTAVAAVLWSWRRTFREFGLVMTLGRGAMTMAFSLIVAFLLFAVGSQFVPSLAVDAWRTSAWSSALRLGLFESVFGPLSFWLVYSSASALGRAQTSFDRVVCSGSAERSIRAAKRFAAATAVCLAVASPTWFHVHRAQCLPFTVFGIAMTAVGVWMFRRVRELAGWLALGDSTTGAATDTPFLYRRLFSAGGIVLMTLGLPLYFLGVSLVLMDVPYWHSSSGGWGTAFGVPFLVPGLLLILSGWLVWRRGRWETGCQQREESIP